MSQVGTEDSTAEEPLPPGEVYRRSVYVEVKRSMRVGVLETFDAASFAPNCEARTTSTAATQSLLLLNNDFVVRQAEAMAARLIHDAGADGSDQVTRAWQLVSGRAPTEQQREHALAFLAEQTAHFKTVIQPENKTPPEQRALATLCQVLVSSNGFLYVD